MLSSSNLADTYLLAAQARSKLTREAGRADHNLRVLVSHANLLDNLMDSLASHRQEQKQKAAAARVTFALPTREPVASPAVYNDNIEYNDDYSDDDSYDYGVMEQYDSDTESDSDDSDNAEDEAEDSASIRDEFYEVTSLHQYFNPMAPIEEEEKTSNGVSYDDITVTSVEEDEEVTDYLGPSMVAIAA